MEDTETVRDDRVIGEKGEYFQSALVLFSISEIERHSYCCKFTVRKHRKTGRESQMEHHDEDQPDRIFVEEAP